MMFLIIPIMVFAALKWNISIMYILFLIMSIERVSKSRMNICDTLLILSIYSVILPDNYMSEFFMIVYFIFFVFQHGFKIKKNMYTYFMFALFLLVFISTVLDFRGITNLLFSFVSFMPLFIVLFLINNKKFNELSFIKFIKDFDKVFIVEIISVPINYVLYHGISGDDWSRGTFGGSGEQAQLFVIFSLMSVMYYHMYTKYGKKRSWLSKYILCVLGMVSTNSWTLFIIYVIGLCCFYLTKLNSKTIFRGILIVSFIIIFGEGVVEKLPDHVSMPLKKILTDNNYLNYRFHKLSVYGETFIEIPSKDLKFALIGEGIGNYNSRAALICTGQYVEFYNKLFIPSMSEYTEEYIYDYVKLAYQNGGSDFGSVLARPYSSVLALMGECGILGIVLFISMLITYLKNKKSSTKKVVIVWLAFCFVENYFEYPKILLLLLICVKLMESIKPKNTEGIE